MPHSAGLHRQDAWWPAMRTAAILLAALAGPSVAAETIRLSPAEIEAALDAAPARTVDPLAGDTLPFDQLRPDRRVHGEVGAFVGTGGSRGAFGTMVAPVGDSGFAAFSFSTERFGERRSRR